MSERTVTENVKKDYFFMVDLKLFLLLCSFLYSVLFIFLESTFPFGAVNALPVKYTVGPDVVELGMSCFLRISRAARPVRSLPLVHASFISGGVGHG